MKVSELIKALKRAGWEQVRQNGSHRHFKHPDKPELVTVSGHKLSDDVPKGLEHSIKKIAGI